MRVIISIAATVVLIAAGMAFVSFLLLAANDATRGFWGNFLLNAATEFIGFSFAAVIGAYIAKWLASKKLEELSEPIVNLIKQLREDGNLKPYGARNCVICVVRFLSDDQIKPARTSLRVTPQETECGVCTLTAAYDDDDSCKLCGLKSKVWRTK